MNLLLTGASGFLGRHVTAELSLMDCTQHVISRRPLPHSDYYSVIVHDFMSEVDWARKIRKPIDAIVHIAHAMGTTRDKQMAFASESTRALLAYATTHRVKLVVLISSLSVLDLTSVPAYGQVDSQTPRLRPAAHLSGYVASKLSQELLVEQAVASGAINALILRPGLIYDATVMSNAYAGLIKEKLQLRVGHAGQIPLVSAQRVAAIIRTALSASPTQGLTVQTVLDDSPWSMAEYQQALVARGQFKPSGMTMPWWLANGVGSVVESLAGSVGLRELLPELLKQPSRAARLKPLRYWTDK